MTMKTTKRKNSAVYKVTCHNEYGNDSADIEVVILGKYISSLIQKVQLRNIS